MRVPTYCTAAIRFRLKAIKRSVIRDNERSALYNCNAGKRMRGEQSTESDVPMELSRTKRRILYCLFSVRLLLTMCTAAAAPCAIIIYRGR